MDYDMKRPCDNCPFLKSGGIRLTKGRVREIAGIFLSGREGDFPCHKTTEADDDDDERHATAKSKHCAGALIFAEKNGTPTQMMRICERIGMYDAGKLQGHDDVFDSLSQMLKTAVR